ncbi:hypothetical protein [Flagellimonas nanhaiensis]
MIKYCGPNQPFYGQVCLNGKIGYRSTNPYQGLIGNKFE